MILSNPEYNVKENGCPTRSDEELKKEFTSTEDKHYLIKSDDTYIGITSIRKKNKSDGYPWIGLFMIHGDYHQYGFGTMAYQALEEMLRKQGFERLRLAVLENNNRAANFWERNGYLFYDDAVVSEKPVRCFEKMMK